MLRLWGKVFEFLKKIFGIKSMPAQVVNGDTLVNYWWDIYASHAPWLPISYVTANGLKNSHTRRTLNPARAICAEVARLVMAEPPEVTGSKLVLDVIKENDLWRNLRKHLEFQCALGGMALKARPENGKIVIDFVTASNFIPLAADNCRVTEASFIDRRVSGDKVYVRIETYRRNLDANGKVVNYTVSSVAFDEASQLAVPLDVIWPNVKPSVDVDITVPPFVYISNPEANNIDPESPLGISIFHNAIDALKSLDITFDEFVWEVESGQRRIALPGVCMRKYLDEETGDERIGLNTGDRVYVRLEGDDAEKFKPTDLTFDIRVEQFSKALNVGLNLLATLCHFDAGYFSFDGISVKTATEIISESSHTYRLREDYRSATDKGLKDLFAAVNLLGALYKVPGTSEVETGLAWDDGVIEDRNSKAKYHVGLVAAGLEDKISAIKAIHGVNEERANEIATSIAKDNPVIVTDPYGVGK
jgi:A118 family predicted phage portal protein